VGHPAGCGDSFSSDTIAATGPERLILWAGIGVLLRRRLYRTAATENGAAKVPLADTMTPSNESDATNPWMPEPVVCAIDTLRETVDREHLPRSARLQVVTRVRQVIVPKESPAERTPALTPPGRITSVAYVV